MNPHHILIINAGVFLLLYYECQSKHRWLCVWRACYLNCDPLNILDID